EDISQEDDDATPKRKGEKDKRLAASMRAYAEDLRKVSSDKTRDPLAGLMAGTTAAMLTALSGDLAPLSQEREKGKRRSEKGDEATKVGGTAADAAKDAKRRRSEPKKRPATSAQAMPTEASTNPLTSTGGRGFSALVEPSFSVDVELPQDGRVKAQLWKVSAENLVVPPMLFYPEEEPAAGKVEAVRKTGTKRRTKVVKEGGQQQDLEDHVVEYQNHRKKKPTTLSSAFSSSTPRRSGAATSSTNDEFFQWMRTASNSTTISSGAASILKKKGEKRKITQASSKRPVAPSFGSLRDNKTKANSSSALKRGLAGKPRNKKEKAMKSPSTTSAMKKAKSDPPGAQIGTHQVSGAPFIFFDEEKDFLIAVMSDLYPEHEAENRARFQAATEAARIAIMARTDRTVAEFWAGQEPSWDTSDSGELL
ncbi:unnamed protein product, partial [Amoebophrya sp. A25]